MQIATSISLRKGRGKNISLTSALIGLIQLQYGAFSEFWVDCPLPVTRPNGQRRVRCGLPVTREQHGSVGPGSNGSSGGGRSPIGGYSRPDGIPAIHHRFYTRPQLLRTARRPGNRRIEVTPGNMPARKNYHHERGTDCQRRQRTATVADDRAPNCQNQKKVPTNSATYVCINNLLRR